MTPITDDIEVRQGAAWSDSFTVVDGDDLPVPLTGCTAEMHVRAVPSTKQPLLALSTANGGLVLDEAAGVISREVTEVQTSALPPGTWRFDLFLTFPDGRSHCVVEGLFTVNARITHP